MKRSDGIGKDWANKILAQGYEGDKKDPMTTKAKVWDKEKKEMVEVIITLGPPEGTKRGSHGYYIDKHSQWKGDMLP